MWHSLLLMLPTYLPGRPRLPRLWWLSSMDGFRLGPRGARWWRGCAAPRPGWHPPHVWGSDKGGGGAIHKPPIHSFHNHLLGKWDRHKGRLGVKPASRSCEAHSWTEGQNSHRAVWKEHPGIPQGAMGAERRGLVQTVSGCRGLLEDWAAGGWGGWGIQKMGRSEKSVITNVCNVDPLDPKRWSRAKSKGVTSSL